MISDNLRLALNGFDLVLMPAIVAGCGQKDIAAARVFRANLADAVANLVEWERATAPTIQARLDAVGLPDNVLRLARKLDRKGVRLGMPTAPDGGDAA